jgi:cellulose synthase (UDP-forming)
LTKPYFVRFEARVPQVHPAFSARRTQFWQFLAGVTVGVSVWYLLWRWSGSLNPAAPIFSIIVASAETLFFVGTLLFFYDIWSEDDTPAQKPPETRNDVGAEDADTGLFVDVYITTFDEDPDILRPSIIAAQNLLAPKNVHVLVWLLDDGNRPHISRLAADFGVRYLQRSDNIGFKAGNLKNALLQTQGDFVLICDADTRVFPNFLTNTLGYFRDPLVAWVQTPHWFYDLPDGLPWDVVFNRLFQRLLPRLVVTKLTPAFAAVARKLTGQNRWGHDPFMADPVLFFDVIQRRRNRNSASFCCGAGSIHRREALFHAGLRQLGRDFDQMEQKFGTDGAVFGVTLQPFKFHVSEDIYTSMKLHSDGAQGWKSVFHPQVESKMLSPWSVDAWTTQKLKYAGGTFDIMLHDNPIFKRGMPWRTKLHYAATFWSYLSVLWVPILLLAPVISLFTSWAPVKAYSVDFFIHILPVLVISEAAMVVGCKGYNVNIGRIMAVGNLPITLRALILVLRGQRPKFPPTPKTPKYGYAGLGRMMPNITLLATMFIACIYGGAAGYYGVDGYSTTFLVVNFFWLGWNALAVIRVVCLAFWQPDFVADDMQLPGSQNLSIHKGALSNAHI